MVVYFSSKWGTKFNLDRLCDGFGRDGILFLSRGEYGFLWMLEEILRVKAGIFCHRDVQLFYLLLFSFRFLFLPSCTEGIYEIRENIPITVSLSMPGPPTTLLWQKWKWFRPYSNGDSVGRSGKPEAVHVFLHTKCLALSARQMFDTCLIHDLFV